MTPTAPGSRRLVALAAAGLVAATGAALTLAPDVEPARSANLAGHPTWGDDDIPGFRANLFALPEDDLAGFVPIPAGSFIMGSDPSVDRMAFAVERWSRTALQGRLDLDDFYMGRYEVTVAQFVDFVRRSGHRLPDDVVLGTEPLHPVASVSWVDALRYARWLDEELRASARTPAPLRALLDDGWRVGLPDEAQWEKAARGADGALFPWGDDPEGGSANYASGRVEPVGSRECACAYGLSDMAGNVWEWTASPYQPYPHDPSDDGRTAAADALWVMRGGSYQDDIQQVRAANRGGADPGARRPFIGFRVALVHD